MHGAKAPVSLPVRLGAAVVAVAVVVGMEGLSAAVLSVAGAAPECLTVRLSHTTSGTMHHQ